MRAQLIVNWVYQDLMPIPAIVVSHFRDKQGKDVVKIVMPDSKSMIVKANKVPDSK